MYESVDSCPTRALDNCSKWLSEEEVFLEVMKDSAFYSDGSVTFSGGDLTVYADNPVPLLKRFGTNNIHTAIEICGHFSSAILPEPVNTTDLFLWDIKDTDNMRHLANTGVSNDRIISNLKEADTLGVKTILRCILLKSINLNTEHLKAIAEIYCALSHCNGVELIPYHTYGASKKHTTWASGKCAHRMDTARKRYLRGEELFTTTQRINNQ